MRNFQIPFVLMMLLVLLTAVACDPIIASRDNDPPIVTTPLAGQFSDDPYLRARQIIKEARPSAPVGWRVVTCEGDAAVLCVYSGQEHVGYAELLLYTVSSYGDDQPVRATAAQLPPTSLAYSEADIAAVQQTLTQMAEEHLAVITEDRAITYPDDTLTPLPMSWVKMGDLPALSFGFVHTNGAGEVVERYLSVVAFDAQFVYWLGANFDSANVSTFVSDAAVTEFAPFLLETAAKLPIF